MAHSRGSCLLLQSTWATGGATRPIPACFQSRTRASCSIRVCVNNKWPLMPSLLIPRSDKKMKTNKDHSSNHLSGWVGGGKPTMKLTCWLVPKLRSPTDPPLHPLAPALVENYANSLAHFNFRLRSHEENAPDPPDPTTRETKGNKFCAPFVV